VKLVEVVLYVRGMDRAIRLYRDTLGLQLETESAAWSTFRTGACTLALHAIERRELGTAEPDPTFLVGDAPAERARLIGAGVEVHGDTRGQSPGSRCSMRVIPMETAPRSSRGGKTEPYSAASSSLKRAQMIAST
jgi:catechol 2,3-dioxygenase-like lactoylglutathione lyase family enzyme